MKTHQCNLCGRHHDGNPFNAHTKPANPHTGRIHLPCATCYQSGRRRHTTTAKPPLDVIESWESAGLSHHP